MITTVDDCRFFLKIFDPQACDLNFFFQIRIVCSKAFFTPLIDLINAYRGDTIKFSGDALNLGSEFSTAVSKLTLVIGSFSLG